MHMASSVVEASAWTGSVTGAGSITGGVDGLTGAVGVVIPRKKSVRIVPKIFIKCVIMVL